MAAPFNGLTDKKPESKRRNHFFGAALFNAWMRLLTERVDVGVLSAEPNSITS